MRPRVIVALDPAAGPHREPRFQRQRAEEKRKAAHLALSGALGRRALPRDLSDWLVEYKDSHRELTVPKLLEKAVDTSVTSTRFCV